MGGDGQEAKGSGLEPYLESFGVDRRAFLKFCTLMAASLGLPGGFARRVAAAVTADDRPPVIYLEFQDCAGNTEAMLRAPRPTVENLILDYISLDYQETIMAAAGHQAEEAMRQTIAGRKGKYIVVVEGGIPLKDNGVYCCIGGRSAKDIAREVCGNAMLTLCAGTCSSFGGIQAAYPNPTGAVGVGEFLPGIPIVNLPGCPLNAVNLTATLVHLLALKIPPQLDQFKRPLFAYGRRIHDNCPRRAHYDAGQYVEMWGDYGHRHGWCLYEMGCKGPSTFHNCPTALYNQVGWPVKEGHGCVGCAEPEFWDTMSPFYERLPAVPGFGVETTATKVGIGLVAAAAAGVGVHAVAKTIQINRHRTREEKHEGE